MAEKKEAEQYLKLQKQYVRRTNISSVYVKTLNRLHFISFSPEIADKDEVKISINSIASY